MHPSANNAATRTNNRWMDYLMIELSAKPASSMLDCPYMCVYILPVDRAHHLMHGLIC